MTTSGRSEGNQIIFTIIFLLQCIFFNVFLHMTIDHIGCIHKLDPDPVDPGYEPATGNQSTRFRFCVYECLVIDPGY